MGMLRRCSEPGCEVLTLSERSCDHEAAADRLGCVAPPLISLIPGTIANHIHGYLPTIAGTLVAQTSQQSGDVLSPWQGFSVFCIWTAVLLGACGYLLIHRDA